MWTLAYRALTFREAPPIAKSRGSTLSVAERAVLLPSHLPREKVQAGEERLLNPSLPCPIWLSPGRGRCQAWQGDGGGW